MLYQQIARNKRKTAFLLVIFLIILALVGGGLGYLINGEPLSGIAIALIGSLIYLFIVLQNPGNLVMSMNHGREIHEEDDPELWHIVEDMSLAGQIPILEFLLSTIPVLMPLRQDAILSTVMLL